MQGINILFKAELKVWAEVRSTALDSCALFCGTTEYEKLGFINDE